MRTNPTSEVEDGGALLVEEVGPLGAHGLDLPARHRAPMGVHLLELVGMLVEVRLVCSGEMLMVVTVGSTVVGSGRVVVCGHDDR